MTLIDTVIARLKKAAGDVADDPALRREGAIEERKAQAKDELRASEREVERKAAEVADIERRRQLAESARRR